MNSGRTLPDLGDLSQDFASLSLSAHLHRRGQRPQNSTTQTERGDRMQVPRLPGAHGGGEILPFLLRPPLPKSLLWFHQQLERRPEFKSCYQTSLERESAPPPCIPHLSGGCDLESKT